MATTTLVRARKNVGKVLKKMREAAKLTQNDVSNHLSYSTPQFISNWERGVATPPNEALPKLAQIFAVSPKKMLEVMYRYQEEVLASQKQEVVNVFRKKRQVRHHG